mgnify:CR=1 FL=1
MLHELLDDTKRNCRDIRTNERTLKHVLRMPDRSRENLCSEPVVVVDLADLADLASRAAPSRSRRKSQTVGTCFPGQPQRPDSGGEQ